MATRRPTTKNPNDGAPPMRTTIRSAGRGNPSHDLCVKRASGYWDVVHGVDGWVVYSPVDLGGSEYSRGSGRFVLVLGAVAREDARTVAEAGIRRLETEGALRKNPQPAWPA